MKEKILEAFKALGFKMEELDEMAFGFSYEGRNFLYIPSDNDEEFLSIALPCVLEEEDADEEIFYQIADKLNSTLKYVKAYKAFDGISLFYERELIGDEDLKMVIRKMIRHLETGLYILHRDIINSDDEKEDDEEDEEIS